MSFSKPIARTCSDCRFAVMQDEGYSNYTVEGTTFYCALDVHPEDGFDRFYDEDDRLKYGEFCEAFEPGGAQELDVDGEVADELRKEGNEVLAWYEGSHR